MTELENINGAIKVRAPSNIAFVKYWGKKPVQYPLNPSVSMTLENCFCEMNMAYQFIDSGPTIDFFSFNGSENKKFKIRIEKYFDHLIKACPYLKNLSLSIQTKNNLSSFSRYSVFCCCFWRSWICFGAYRRTIKFNI